MLGNCQWQLLLSVGMKSLSFRRDATKELWEIRDSFPNSLKQAKAEQLRKQNFIVSQFSGAGNLRSRQTVWSLLKGEMAGLHLPSPQASGGLPAFLGMSVHSAHQLYLEILCAYPCPHFFFFINKCINNIRLEVHSNYCLIKYHYLHKSPMSKLSYHWRHGGDTDITCGIHSFINSPWCYKFCIPALFFASWALSLLTSTVEAYSMD